MSLTGAERARTVQELRANLALSGFDHAQLIAATGFTERRLTTTLALEPGCDPVDVWRLRDVLEQAVRAAGGTPVPYTVLTERARRKARGWFGVR